MSTELEIPKETLQAINGAHMINLRIRINGEWKEFEADWVRELVNLHKYIVIEDTKSKDEFQKAVDEMGESLREGREEIEKDRKEREKQISKKLRRLYYKIFKRYTVLETRLFTYREGDKIMRETHDKPENEQWVLSDREDTNIMYGLVFLCRKVRIVE